MSEVRIQHHVFSSDGGYRTTFASPDLAPEVVKRMETFASVEQTVFSAGPAHACHRLEDGQVVVCRTFVHGADHVGRKRICSHSILLPGAVRRLEGFNAAAPPGSLFMGTDVPAERPGPYLPSSWDVPEDADLGAQREQARQSLARGPHLPWIVDGLLAPSRVLVMAAPLATGFAALGRAAWLLPPEVRHTITYRTGTWRPEQLESTGEVTAVVVPDSELLEAFAGGEFVHVDMHRDPADGPSREGYAGYLTSMANSPLGEQRVGTLMNYLAAFPGPRHPSRDQQSCFVQAYRLLEPTLMADDLGDAVVRSSPRLVPALVPLAKSGREAMAHWLVGLLEEAAGRLERPVVREALDALRQEQAGSFFLKGQDIGARMTAYGQRLREAATKSST